MALPKTAPNFVRSVTNQIHTMLDERDSTHVGRPTGASNRTEAQMLARGFWTNGFDRVQQRRNTKDIILGWLAAVVPVTAAGVAANLKGVVPIVRDLPIPFTHTPLETALFAGAVTAALFLAAKTVLVARQAISERRKGANARALVDDTQKGKADSAVYKSAQREWRKWDARIRKEMNDAAVKRLRAG